MKVLVKTLKEGEHAFSFATPSDGWVNALAEHVEKQGHTFKEPLAIDMNLLKLKNDYYLRAEMRFALEQPCARCAEPFFQPIQHRFHLALCNAESSQPSNPKVAAESEDVDVIFFQGHELDLRPIFEEQFFLSLPYQGVCSSECKGVCQHCGANLNFSSCQCGGKTKESPFAVLKTLKDETKK